jgi:hypothetical protein
MVNYGKLKAFLEGQMPVALEQLRQMVGINSFHRQSRWGKSIGRFTADCFSPLGFKAEFVAIGKPELRPDIWS